MIPTNDIRQLLATLDTITRDISAEADQLLDQAAQYPDNTNLAAMLHERAARRAGKADGLTLAAALLAQLLKEDSK